MACKIIVTPQAEKDIDGIYNFLIDAEQTNYLKKLDAKIEHGYNQIKNFPESCPKSLANENLRKLNIDKYLIFYDYVEKTKTIRVYRMFHGMADYEKSL
jgi:plasmid stabilization system protein ParE